MLLGTTAQAGPKDKKKKGKHAHDEVSLTMQLPKKGKRFSKRQRKQLRKIALHLKAHPELGQITIVGHTDVRGKAARNQKLSLKRAKAVKKFLVKLGVSPDRLVAEGKGSTELKNPKKNKKAHRQNQRIELIAAAAVAPVAAPIPAPVAEEPPAPPAEELAAADSATTSQTTTAPAAAASEAEPWLDAPAITPAAPPAPEKAAEVIPEKIPEPTRPKAGAMDIKTQTATPIKTTAPQVIEEPSPDRTALWVSLGVTLAATLAAVTQGTMAASKADELDTLFVGTTQYENTISESQSMALVSDISIGVAAIGLASAIWYFFDDDVDDSATQVGAAVTPTGASVFLRMPLGGDEL